MCGINGFCFEDLGLIGKMNTSTAHRGPDGTGVWSTHGATFGHNRLAIIDLSDGGKQPMHAGPLTITYNGELYNYQELKRELSDYKFVSESDTEVILASYLKWGVDAFKRFNGIFAFAIWDARTETLVLARDRAGIKPLYYAKSKGKYVFSSEIKALFAHDVPRTLDQEALALYLRLAYVPGPRTLFSAVKKFPQGKYGVVKGDTLELHSFVEPSHVSVPGNYAARTRQLADTIDAAASRQLVSDRPVGVYLSGGIDSSVILDAVSRAHAGIDTFSVGFSYSSPEEDAKYNADFHLAEATAHHYGTRHHALRVTNEDMAALLDEVAWHMDEPTGSATALPMMALSRFAKEHVTVVLGGDGGDELFGGYERYRLARMLGIYERMPMKFPVGKLRDLPEAGSARLARFLFQKDAVISRYVRPEVFRASPHAHFDSFFSGNPRTFTEEFMRADEQSILVDGALVRADKMSMAGGVEERVPLLDNEVVEYAHALPLSDKVGLTRSKRILKDAYRGRIPAVLLNQPKRGWFAPGSVWLKDTAFEGRIREALQKDYAPATADLFDWKEVESMLTAHREGREYHYIPLWSLLMLQLWARKFDATP